MTPRKPQAMRSKPRDSRRDMQQEETGPAADGHRDLVHGDGGTIAVPASSEDLSRDD